MEYLDFELRIAGGKDRQYPVAVIKSPVGEASGILRFPFDSAALENQLRGVEIAVLKSASVQRGVVEAMGAEGEATETPSVLEFGTRLFEALFVDQVLGAFRESLVRARRESKGLRVRLRIDAADLSSLPWEFMYDAAEGDHVCLSKDTPLVRYLEFNPPLEMLSLKPPISVLGMIASPSDRPGLNVEQERQRMEKAAAGLQQAGLVRLEWLEGSTWRDLMAALRRKDIHIFHFVGHGGFDEAAGEGVLAFCDDDGRAHLMSATEIGRLLADEPLLRLVVLNSCLGARGNSTNVFSSSAATLVRRGVPAVVAMQYEISDQAAIEFSRTLYDALADGSPVDAAVAEARKAVSFSAHRSVEWATPVLFMRSPDGMLFKIDGLTTSQARSTGAYRVPVVHDAPAPPPPPAATASPPSPTPAPVAAPPVPVPSESALPGGAAAGS